MFSLHIPRVFAKGRWWSADEVDSMTRRMHQAAVDAVGSSSRLVVAIVPPSIDGVVMVLAASALESVVVLLPSEPRAWRSEPAIPAETPFLLMSSCAHFAEDVRRVGGRPVILDELAYVDAPAVTLLGAPGMVWFTSGSTGLPKPIFRTTDAIRACIDQRLAALPLARGTGVVSGDSLAHGQGLVQFLLSCRLAGSFGTLDTVSMRATLAVLRMPDFGIWFTAPHVADLLTRVPFDGAPVVPALCFVAGAVSHKSAAAFDARFGRPLRQHYGSSEAGPVSLDNRADEQVRPDTVGRIVHGVHVCVGGHPSRPMATGGTGRIWIRSAGHMAGYGFPPDLDRSEFVDGWLPTRDLGALSDDGYLTLAGRIDDCVRMRDGRLINLALVASRLREVDGIGDAVAVAVETEAGAVCGAVVEGTPLLDHVRQQLAMELPPWSLPKNLVAVEALPRLSNGKVDRAACVCLLSVQQVSAPPA